MTITVIAVFCRPWTSSDDRCVLWKQRRKQ